LDGAENLAGSRPVDFAQALQRVLGSVEFSGSKRLQRFLSYIVEQTLAGRQDEIKEYPIALAVFDREASFDPRTDTIVRVQARRLRQQLAAYYANGGSGDPLIIELGKGGYVPVFRQRDGAGVGAPPGRRQPKRTILIGLAALVAGIVLAAGGWHYRYAALGCVPENWAFDGPTLAIFDARERVCWEKRFPPSDSPYIRDRVLIDDIDGDGRKEVLVNLYSKAPSLEGGRLACFDQGGRPRWEFRYGAARTFGTRTFEPNYIGRLIRPVSIGGKHYLLTVANHYLWYPSQVALLDAATGRLREDYWHPGAIYECLLRDIDGDGAPEFLFGAINNPGEGLGHAALGVLKIPFSKSPRAPATAGPFPPVTGGGEMAYVLFPLPDVSAAMGMLPMVFRLEIDSSRRILFEVPLPESGAVVYYLDFDLNVLEYRVSDNFAALHERLRRQQLLNHPFSGAEAASLGKVVRFRSAPDGNAPAVNRLWQH
jgi:hypothetical protein